MILSIVDAKNDMKYLYLLDEERIARFLYGSILTNALNIRDIRMCLLDVTQKVSFSNECFATLAATEWLFTSVATTMRHQMPLRYEIFWAEIATERSLCFHSLVMATLMEEQVSFEWK